MSHLANPSLISDSPAGQSNSDVLQQMLLELRAIRLAMVSLATQGGLADPEDFNPEKNDFTSSGNTNR